MKKRNLNYLLLIAALYLSTACSRPGTADGESGASIETKASEWPHSVSYEIFVQSFCDSDNDGIGDIKGMTSKLDYLADLGIEAVWLMPMSPSPSYHKYDVTDYYGIHPDYGTMEDFKAFVAAAHERNIKVVIDLVVNHSSNEHPWFVESAKDEKSPYRDYYVWAHKDDPQTKGEGKTTGDDSHNVQHWHEVKSSDYKYFGYFWGGMPDLNFDNPKVRQEIYKVGRFWLEEVGVDGFRLDAARHIFPDDRPDDNHAFWEEFKAEMQKVKPDVYLVGEVWGESDIVAPYMKGLPALFNFELSWKILDALKTGNGDSIAFHHSRMRNAYQQVNPNYVDATILSNHDQNRIMSEVNGDVNKAKVASALLFTLPGAPYVYYGEEIGMQGKKPDELIREPFLWDTKVNDDCRTSWVTSEYSTEQHVKPVAQQAQDPNSLLNHYKAYIRLRNSSKALTMGDLEPVKVSEKSVSAYVRSLPDESILVLHNLSGKEVSVAIPASVQEHKQLLHQRNAAKLTGNTAQLPAYSSLILRK